jgi:hypothetical protein
MQTCGIIWGLDVLWMGRFFCALMTGECRIGLVRGG